MATVRHLIDYLPPFMREYAELQQITDAEQPMVDNLAEQYVKILDNQFIEYANEDGIKRWETMLGISPKDTDTIEERRFRILSTINKDTPYTILKLKEILNTLCGEDGYEITLGEFSIVVKIALANESNFDIVETSLRNIIPANMLCSVLILFTTHEELRPYTHGYLYNYTHLQIRRGEF